MEYRFLGRSGLQVSALSLGAWVTYGNQVGEDVAYECMRAAYDSGVNFFDNAEVYGDGQSEILMGMALKKAGWLRDSYIVSSKVMHSPYGKNAKPTQLGLSRKHVFEACHQAMNRLQVDYLDLYFCHRPDPEVPIEETVRVMTELIVRLTEVSLISFFIITLTPGSPYPWGDLNPKISKASKESYRKKFHLDQPLHKQFAFIMRDMFTGKLVSNKDERPVLRKIMERAPVTISLNVVALVIEFSFGIALGIYGARFRGTWRDRGTATLAFALIALPGFWLSYLLCIFLVEYVQIPILGLFTFNVDHQSALTMLLDRAWHLFTPAFILALGSIGVMSRYVRSSLRSPGTACHPWQ